MPTLLDNLPDPQTAQPQSGFVIHPLLVHFPIALLLAGSVSLLCKLLIEWRNSKNLTVDESEKGIHKPEFTSTTFSKNLEIFAIGTLILGYAALVFSIGAGLMDLLGSPRTLARDGWIVFAIIHLSTGFGLLVVYGILLYRYLFSNAPSLSLERSIKFDWLTFVIALLGIILVIITGWFGGELVYSYRVGIN